MNKQQFRKEMIDKLNNLSETTYNRYTNEIKETVVNDPCWKTAKVIGLTIAKFPEVNTKQLIETAWQENKIVVVPKCHPVNRQMTFHKITSFSDLEIVYYGLFEPILEKTLFVPKDDIELLFVPGLIYTRSGYRIGFGGGYYDRFLTDFSGMTVSIAFSCQIVHSFPIEKHDLPVRKIITNTEVITIE